MTSLLVALPLLCFAALALAAWRRSAEQELATRARTSFLAASVAWGVLLVGATETLSLFHALTGPAVACFWGLATAAAAVVAQRDRRPWCRPRFRWVPALDLCAVGVGLVALMLAVGLNALLAPPNGSDALSYHLPRVVHWIHNASVEHYPTNLLRQLNLSPGAEFILLHLQLLSGGDRYTNLVQWFSWVGSALTASLIAGQLGAAARGQLLAAVACATIPVAVLEASGAQNDLVVAYWLLGFAYYTVRVVQVGPTWLSALGAGGTLGLALATKGTAFFFAAPILAWYLRPLVDALKQHRLRPTATLLAVPLLVVALNAGYTTRNVATFGDPFGRVTEMRNDERTPQALLSNVVRNLALHLASPLPGLDQAVTDGVLQLHRLFGVDAGNPRTTFLVGGFFMRPWRLDESYAVNTLHMVAIVATFALLARWWRRVSLEASRYALLTLTGLVLFIYLLKWQPANARLQLPFFILLSPLVGLVLGVSRPLGLGVSLVLLLSAVPPTFLNEARPLVGSNSVFVVPREDQYLARDQTGQLRTALAATGQVAESTGCRRVGLISAIDFWEHALWARLSAGDPDRVSIEHIFVENASAVWAESQPYRNFRPCLIVSALQFETRLQFIDAVIGRFGTYENVRRLCQERYRDLFSCSLLDLGRDDPPEIIWREATFHRVLEATPLSVYTSDAGPLPR